jgi:uncharacterized protein
MQLSYPLRFDGRGRTAETSDDQHIRDLIEQVLFTSPGERVNRPTFGSGLLQTVFEPAGDQLVATLNLLIQSSLHQWLGDLIVIDSVEVDASDGTLTVQVVYTIRRTQQQIASTFQRLGVAA